MTPRIPESFYVEAHGYGLAVGWKNGDRRYHFWLNETGEPKDDILHSNPVEEKKSAPYRDQHRALDRTAKKWAPLVKAMMDKIEREGLVALAVREKNEKDEAERVAARRKADDEALGLLQKASRELPMDLRTAIDQLPEVTRVAFVRAILVEEIV
jgi:hypothetical protein